MLIRSLFCQRKGYSTLEYVVMIVVIATVLLSFMFYIRYAYQGQMSTTAESFSFGRMYSPRDTIVCIYDGVWYSEACYNHKIGLNPAYDQGLAKSECTLGCAQ